MLDILCNISVSLGKQCIHFTRNVLNDIWLKVNTPESFRRLAIWKLSLTIFRQFEISSTSRCSLHFLFWGQINLSSAGKSGSDHCVPSGMRVWLMLPDQSCRKACTDMITAGV